MARTNNLTNFLTDVATSIKTKTGDSAPIPANQFDTKIANITTGHLDNTEYTEANDDVDDILENTVVPTGTISITTNGEYDVTNYVNADVSVVSTPIFLPDNIKFGNSASSSNDMTWIEKVDTSYITNMSYFFNYCVNFKTAPIMNTSNVINASTLFGNCSALEDVPVYDMSSITGAGSSQMFANCPNLTNESLNNILETCIGMINITANRKNLKNLGLSQTQATTCQTLSNWNDFVTAGWSTGY